MNSNNVIVIVGRPNVGKSTLFNRLVGKRISIVHEEPGVTRDRVEVKLEWKGVPFRLVDTGGINPGVRDPIHLQVEQQVREAIEEGNLLLFVVDALEGLTPLDEEVAALIRPSGKKTLLVVNKVDNPKTEMNAQEFHRLGFKSFLTVSSLHGIGFGELQDQMEENITEGSKEEGQNEVLIKMAVVGKPNVGKSTLINRLIGQSRLVVDPQPGTTRDAIDVELKMGDRVFTLVDTAGMRKRKQVRSGLETFSVIRALKSIQRADLAILVLDASSGVTAQDVRILDEVRKSAKGCVLALNKWDLVRTIKEKDFSNLLMRRWKFLDVYPFVFCSALTGLRLRELMDQAVQVYENARYEIPEPQLEDFLKRILSLKQPPSCEGHVPKIYSMVQAGVSPPEFHVYVSEPRFIKESYKLFIENELRKPFGFKGVTIQFKYKKGRASV